MLRSTLRCLIAGMMCAVCLPASAQDDAVEPSGILVLDNCDDAYDGKDEYHDNLTLVDPSGEQVFRISGFNNCESIGSSHEIAVDYDRERIWVIENAQSQIRQFDFAGNEILAIPDVDSCAIAVDPETGNLWVLVGQTIYSDLTVYNGDGQRTFTYGVSGYDIAYDPDAEAFWIAGSDLSKIDTVTGEVAFTVPISTWCASSVDVDPNTGCAWVALREHSQVAKSTNRLLRFDGTGEMTLAIDLGQRRPFRVSVDPTDSSAWVANMRDSVEHYSAEGDLLAEHQIEALAVEVDSTGAAWVVTPLKLQRIDEAGELTAPIEHAGDTSQAWISALE